MHAGIYRPYQGQNDSHSRQVIKSRTQSALLESVPSFDPLEPSTVSKQRVTPGNPWSDLHRSNAHDDTSVTDEWVDEESDGEKKALLKVRREKSSDPAVKRWSKSDRSTKYDPHFSVASSIGDVASVRDFSGLGRDELVAELLRVKKQRDVYRQRLDFCQDAALARGLNPAQERSDLYFMDQVEQLRYWIIKWSRKYFSHASKYNKNQAARCFDHLTSKYTILLDSAGSRPRLIQASVWYLLQDIVLGDRYAQKYGYFWLGCKRRRGLPWKHHRFRELQPLEILLQRGARTDSRTYSEYQEWRSLTYNLLFPGMGKAIKHDNLPSGDIEAQRDRMAERIWRKLYPYAKVTSTDRSLYSAKAGLRIIVEDAMALSLDFKKQKVDFYFPQHLSPMGNYYDIPFYPEEMEPLDSIRNAEKVELVVCPALAKFGGGVNAVDMNSTTILMPSFVLCNISAPKTHKVIQKRLPRDSGAK